VRVTTERDTGTMALELALLTPLLVAFMMVMVGLGRVVEAKSQVDGAARDAARAASLERSRSQAHTAAEHAAEATLSGRKWCRKVPSTSVDLSAWGPGGQVSVTVSCDIDLTGLSLIGFRPSRTMTGNATAPIDTLRGIDEPPTG
jgi:Flp pilus assembly protein TadG